MERSVVWAPSEASARASAMEAFRLAAQERTGKSFAWTVDLHAWSVAEPDGFWSLVWDVFGVRGTKGDVAWVWTVLPEATFFPHARLNLAENLLALWMNSDDPAVLYVREREGADDGHASDIESVSGREMCRQVAAFAAALRAAGVEPGERVALVMPAGPQALVCTLGALAIGAVVASVSPEFGAPAILDRLGQLEPSVLVGSTSYQWAGRVHDRRANLDEVVAGLPSVHLTLVGDDLDAVLAQDADLVFERLPFDHPAYVLFSSGTTGKPKCLVHRAGGVLLKHLVEIGLHADVRAGDRLLFYSTTSWMMWNWQASALALGAAVVLFEGAPTYPDALALPDAARRAGATHLGAGAQVFDVIRREGLSLSSSVGPALREVLVTGSPLSSATAAWMAGELGPAVMINPISGGTDLVGCFVGGDPTRPFVAGEMTGPILGTAVDVFDETGVPASVGEPGELVCTQPFPTVPLGIWSDDTGERLRATYFDRWPGVWVHGDVAVRTTDGGIAILGRSDSTLNVGGVRIGTAEIYAALADHPVVAEALAFGQSWDDDTRLVLLVVVRSGAVLDDAAVADIRATLRRVCSPRHVPQVVVDVPALPRTHSGKLSEVAVRDAVNGKPVRSLGALANPETLDQIVSRLRA